MTRGAPHDDDALVEELLVLRAQMGARDAFEALFAQHDDRLCFYLRRLVGRAADADDLRQEVWLAVVRKLGTLEEPRAFRAWLYQIARHRAISWLRKRRAEVPVVDGNEPVAPLPDDDGPAFTADEAAAVYAALDLLSASHREMLSLRFLSELSYDEVARVLACPVGTVRSRIHYAKAALRAALLARSQQKGERR